MVWTAKHPDNGPVIVGLYDDATIYRFMPDLTEKVRPFIAKARVENCHLVPESRQTFEVIRSRIGFPGMAAAWFPALHATGPAHDILDAVARHLPTIRHCDHAGK